MMFPTGDLLSLLTVNVEKQEPLIKGQEPVVSLFVVSKGDYRLRKLNLSNPYSELKPEELHQCVEEQRLLAVIAIGEKMCGYANTKFIDELSQQNRQLSFEGMAVEVSALSDEDYTSLSSVVNAIFDQCVTAAEEEKAEEKKEEETHDHANHGLAHTYLSRAPHEVHLKPLKDSVLLDVAKKEGEIISKIIEDSAKAREELKERQKEDDKQQRILASEIKREVLKKEIENEEIKKSELRQSDISGVRK